MADMIALKPFTYATRALRAGQHFATKTDRDARILIAIGKATRLREAGTIAPPPPELKQKIEQVAKAAKVEDPAAEDLAALRAKYKEITGKKPFHGWNVEDLQAKIAKG